MRSPDLRADALDRLVTSILQSARHRHLCPDVVRRVGARELTRRKREKDAEKETRSRLHQIGGAYLENRPPYTAWLERLRVVPDRDTLLSEFRRMMLCHASTRERLPFLAAFYARTLASIRPIRSVADIACGLNGLALPWMALEEGCQYAGYDLYSDMTAFFVEALSVPMVSPKCHVRAETCDLAVGPPATNADLALVLKFLPLLDDPTANGILEWLQRLNTRYALVSFPTRTLGGRNVGMANTYAGRFREAAEAARWSSERFEFPNELCFLVELNRVNEQK